MENFRYSNPVELLYGNGQLDKVGELVAPCGKKVLLVYGKNHIKAHGVYERIVSLLNDKGLTVFDLEGVKSNPELSLVKKGIEICRAEKIDFILAAGGGSSSDTAKAVGIGAKVNYDIWQAYEDFHNIMHGNKGDFNHVPSETLPVGVIMTKAATGSDFDYTSVLGKQETREKLMIINKVLYPKFSILEPSLTYTLPQKQIVFGVADIMTHYMEQYFSISKDTLILDRIKEAGIRTVIESGKTVYDNPRDYNAQGNLLYCAAWACSDQSMTGIIGSWAAHQIEHELSGIMDINHGHGMAIVYIGWMKYVLDALPAKFARFAEEVWGVERKGRRDIDVGLEGIERTASFWKSLGIPLSFKEAGIDPAIIPQAAERAVRFGPLGLIKQLHKEDVVKILESVR